MKAIVNTAPGRLEMRELPLPEPASGRVRIRTAACGICATDLAMIDGWERTGFPSVPGHEWSGVIDAVGEGVGPELRGMPCVGENVLVDGGEVGFEHPGGYGEFFVTDAKNLHALPKGCSLAAAALIEPLASNGPRISRVGLLFEETPAPIDGWPHWGDDAPNIERILSPERS